MHKDEKIKNAAKYWYECEKEGFPKSQEEVFKEWLLKDSEHKKAYEKLKDIQIDDPKNELKKTRYYLATSIILSLLLVLTILIINK